MCHFSNRHLPRRRDALPDSLRDPSVGSENTAEPDRGDGAHNDALSFVVGISKYDGLQELYVDRLLASDETTAAVAAQSPSLHDLGVFGGCRGTRCTRLNSPVVQGANIA